MAAFSAFYPSPLGRIVLRADGEALTGLWFEGQRYAPAAAGPRRDDLPIFALARAWLDGYFADGRPDPHSLPLSPEGSAFRRTVWALLLKIPYGETVTYGALAAAVAGRLGRASMSAQAVGGAVGHNPLSIVIPCHRVLGADGALTGYAGGLDRKRWLLRHEAADPVRRP